MKKTSIFLALGLFSASLRAEILIYHGSASNFTTTNAGIAAAQHGYLLIERNGIDSSATLIIYGKEKVLGKEKMIQQLYLSQVGIDELNPDSTNEEVYAYTLHQAPSPGAFGDDALFARGARSNVIVSGSLHSGTKELHAATMKGIYRHAGAGFNSYYYEYNLSLAFNEIMTLSANNGPTPQNLAQVEQSVQATLQGQGYSP